jgi:hypothetical protein
MVINDSGLDKSVRNAKSIITRVYLTEKVIMAVVGKYLFFFFSDKCGNF